jgi:hypothetical protein
MKTRCLFALLSTSIVLGSTNAALADPTKQECLDAFEKQQSMRAQNKLRTARDAAKVCASPSCGRIAPDCAKSALDIAALIPTIVFEAKDGDGHDVAAVKVSMDGQKIADKLEGSALEVDIGDHEFVFEANGQTVKQRFVIREGDKVRHEKVTIGQPTPATTTTTTTPPTTTPTQPPPPAADTPKAPDPAPTPVDTGSTGTGQRVAGAVIGVVGIVGAAIGTYYLVSYSSDNSSFPTDGQKLCGGIGQGTTCPPAQDLKSSIESESVKGGVALGIGGALIVTGLIVFLTAPSHHTATSSLQLVPTMGRGSGGLVLGGSF